MSKLPEADAVSWQAARECLGPEGLLSIILPCHGLERVIAVNIRQVIATFQGRLPFEIIAVDDGSADNTLEFLRAVARECQQLKIVALTLNQGKGQALRTGFAHARGTHVLFLDADLDLPPYQVAWFFERLLETNADIVIGAKRHPRSELKYPLNRRISSVVYCLLVRLLFGLPVRDTQTGIKLFKRDALEVVMPRMLVKRFAYDLEMLAIARHLGFKIAEAPVKLNYQGGEGCLSMLTIRNVINDTLAVFYRLRILRYYQTLKINPAPVSPPLVSVLIACPAVSVNLHECLRGLESQIYRRFEVLLLPDSSTGTAWPAGVREITTGQCRPAEKRNLGIREARGEIIAFLDDDTVPLSGWLDEAVRYFGDPEVGAVGGPGVTPRNDTLRSRLSGRVFANPLVSGRYRYRYTPTRVRRVDELPSCNLLVRKSVLDEIGGFRTDFWPGEDTILCLEIIKRGCKIYYDPRVLVYHHRRPLFGPHLRQVGRYARHRGYFVRQFPTTTSRLAYMLPALLLLGLAGGALAAVAVAGLRPLYLGAVLSYVLLTGLSSISIESLLISKRINLKAWILTWAGVMATHLVYGYRFLAGLLSARMPAKVGTFDHVSESSS